MPFSDYKEPSPDLIPKSELVFDSFEDMVAVLLATTRNEPERNGDYCVLVSREENLYVLNFLYSENCDRNNVVFMDRDVYEDELFRSSTEEKNDDV